MDKKNKIFNTLKENISSGVRLPKIRHSKSNGEGEPAPPFRSSFRVYGKTHPLKLPELGFQSPIEESNIKPETPANRKSSLYSAKSTKQEMFSRESGARDSKISDRLSLEIDMKISHVNRSFSDFVKKSHSVNENIQNAVRRSAADSIRNRSVTSAAFPEREDSKKCYDKYLNELDKQIVNSNDVLEVTSPRSCPKMFGLDPLTVLESSDNSSEDSDSDSSFHNPKNTAPSHGIKQNKPLSAAQRKYTEIFDDIPRTLSPVMGDLSDKAFLTKLKKREGQTNKSIQQMQTQLNAIHQKVEIDRRKANLQANKSKPLYKPRNRNGGSLVMGFNTIKGPRTDLIDFVQASGGNTGSWGPENHARFLKAYNQWKDQPTKLIDNIMQQVKGKSAKEVMAHVKWYEQYDSLNQANKDQLRNWDMKKRPAREVIYQMASEGHKAKLENEKRRQDHMKIKRVEERQRSQAILTAWKKSKPIDDSVEKLDMNDIQKEMLDIAEKIQSLNSPGKKKLKPPRKSSNSASTKRDAGKKSPNVITESEDAQYNDHIMKCRQRESLSTTHNSHVAKGLDVDVKKTQVQRLGIRKLNSVSSSPHKLRNNNLKLSRSPTQNIIENMKIIQETEHLSSSENGSDILNSTVSSIQTEIAELKPSKLTNETYSHRLHREAQRCKRMEVQSQRSRVPNRMEDSNLWETSNALQSLGSKKATPSWRKAS